MAQNSAFPMGSPVGCSSGRTRSDRLQQEEVDNERAIRRKIRDLLSAQKEVHSEDDCTDSDSGYAVDDAMDDGVQSEDEAVDRQKEMELTAKVLLEKVERLKRERMALEQKWSAKSSGDALCGGGTMSTTAMMEREMGALRRRKENECESEWDSRDSERSDVDSIMSFSDNDRYSDHDRSGGDGEEEEDGVKTFAKLRKEQSQNLSRLERVYNARKSRNSASRRSSRRSQSGDDEKSETVDGQRPRTAPSGAPPRRRITIPEPFHFDSVDREKMDSESISKRRFREYLESIRKEEEYHLRFEFKAKAVPLSAVTTKMDKMVHGLKGKRVSSSKKASAVEPEEVFTAKKVPWFVKVKLYDAMMAEESTKRRDRIKQRADRLLSAAALPPRMRLYESAEQRTLKNKKMERIESEHFSECTFAPDIKHSVPDFESEHRKFQKQLLLRKEAKVPVLCKGFSFCDEDDRKLRQKRRAIKEAEEGTAAAAAEQKEDKALQRTLEDAQRRIRAMIANPPKIVPKSTRKFDESVAMKREKARKAAMDAFVLEEAVRNKEEKVRAKWKGVLEKHLVDNTATLQQQRLQSQREAAAAQRESALHWKRQKKAMMKRVAERPLLVQSRRMQMERQRAKKKALLLVHDSLQKAGITKFDDFFDQNELEQLQKIKGRS